MNINQEHEHLARFWSAEAGKLRCGLCPHECLIVEGGVGRCGTRRAAGGRLVAAGYGRVSSAHLDPIEKKPLYHFLPGSLIFSVGGWGCNFTCSFCQNWSISQERRMSGSFYEPAQIVEVAARDGSIGLAYTYNEPLINFEFVQDCARLARKSGLANVLVSNGFLKPEPAAELLPLVDAINLDIKSMEDAFYMEQCGAKLQPVLDFAVQAVAAGCHIEITNLLIPGLNDSDDHIERLAGWMAEHLGPATPLHLSAYHPDYRLDRPATSRAILLRTFETASARLHYVYIGNMRVEQGRDTCCPGCGAVLLQRAGFDARRVELNQTGSCNKCGRASGIVMELKHA